MGLIYCYGNCQARIIAKYLRELSKSWEVKEFYVENCICKLDVDSLRRADIFIYQHCSEKAIKNPCDHPAETHKYTSKYLVDHIIKPRISISFPSIYYSAYFTGCLKTQPFPGLPNYSFNTKLWEALEAEKSLEEMKEIVCGPTYETADVLRQERETYNELKRREGANKTTVGIADFLHENQHSVRMMHTTNHPTKHLYQHLLNEILKEMGLPRTDLPLQLPDFALKEQCVPIFKSVFAPLGMKFSDDGPYYVEGKECPTLEDYLRHYQEIVPVISKE